MPDCGSNHACMQTETAKNVFDRGRVSCRSSSPNCARISDSSPLEDTSLLELAILLDTTDTTEKHYKQIKLVNTLSHFLDTSSVTLWQVSIDAVSWPVNIT